ncbi:MAG TPA: DUF2231 domain-containing protein [Terriglobales bacterium]|nr:DUF2231 domain-containing protein [Terriglobales bacterium]
MIQFPPLPDWSGLHPLVIHFPIALLLIAPLFVLVGALLKPEKGRAFLIAALVLMAIGTCGTYLAVATGEAAGKIAERTPEINAVLEHHEELAERTRASFTVLTIIFAAILFVPGFFHRESNRAVSTILPLVFIVLYGVGALFLANTAHNGGRLVHEFGVKALVASSPVPASNANAEGDSD